MKKCLGGGVTPELLSQYPETHDFTEVLAKHIDTDPQHLCLTNGSAEGIRYIIEAFTSVGGTIVGVTPSYAMFEVYAAMYGRHYEAVNYSADLTMDVQRILAKLDPSVQLLILLNPNNPIGNVYTDDEMAKLIKVASDNEITVLIDEAYHYFYPKSFIYYTKNCEHIFVTRSFSKLFSLAGCRLGYVCGWPEGVRVIQKMCTPHNVNAFAMLFAKAILEDEALLQELIDKQADGKRYLIERLHEEGHACHPGAGNFVFITPRYVDACDLVRRMREEKRILIKAYSGMGMLEDCLRVTTGEKKYMQCFADALFELDVPDVKDA